MGPSGGRAVPVCVGRLPAVVAARPQDADAQLRLATGLLALGQFESALRAFQGALQCAPELTYTALKALTTAGRREARLSVEMLAAAPRGRPWLAASCSLLPPNRRPPEVVVY